MGLVMQELDYCLSGTHGLNEELGKHRGREGKSKYALCGAECESVVHKCSAYSDIKVIFVEKLQELLGDRYVNLNKLNNIEKTLCIILF